MKAKKIIPNNGLKVLKNVPAGRYCPTQEVFVPCEVRGASDGVYVPSSHIGRVLASIGEIGLEF